MTENRNDSGASPHARTLFAQYANRVESGEGVDYTAFRERHGALADQLDELREAWISELARNGRSARPVATQIRDIRGAEVDPRITLDRRERGDPGAAVDEQQAEQRIGRYSGAEALAEGGQGVVLRVFDQDLHRHLAMKVLRGGTTALASVDSRTLGRFLEEAQVTGQLDHPGIVPVHELGLDEGGGVYFTMKLVKGEELGSVFDKVRRGEEGWTLTRALNVLVKVCEAMTYAHHRRVIHRDLKPANVMVGRFGEVYVMDWGVARVLDRQDTHDVRIRGAEDGRPGVPHDAPALLTMDGDIVGTPAYMPPEQAAGNLEAMGPHSDVYSVGAMLYQLLAGHEPHATGGGCRNPLDVLLALMAGPPASLASEAPGAPQELVAICEKAMARDPAERYVDMGGMAAELTAFLEGRVVGAYETGAVAELRKWVVRNRALATAMLAGVLVLVVGLVATVVQKRRADANAQLALEREESALQAEARATAEARRASKSAETAQQVSDFLIGLFQVADPGETRGNTITAREILDQGAQRIESELGEQPEVQATLMATMGTVYKSLGLYDAAVPLLTSALANRRESFGEDHPLVAASMNELGEVLGLKAEYAEAEARLREALELRRRLFGDEHPNVAESMHDLAYVLDKEGEYAAAEPLLRDALRMRRQLLGRAPEVAATLNDLALDLFHQGDTESPGPLLREALEMRRELLGEHPAVAESLNNLGVFLYETGEVDAAEEMFRQGLDLVRRLMGDVHPEVAMGLNNLAFILHDEHQFDAAEEMYRQALATQRQLLGDVHPNVAQAVNNLAVLLFDKGDHVAAKEAFFASLEVYRELFDDEHPSVVIGVQNTLQFMEQYVPERQQELAPDDPELAAELVDLGELRSLAGFHERALAPLEQALAILGDGDAGPDRQSSLARAESVLGAALAGLGEFQQAEGLLLGASAELERLEGRDAVETRNARRRLVKLYESWGRPESAAEYGDGPQGLPARDD